MDFKDNFGCWSQFYCWFFQVKVRPQSTAGNLTNAAFSFVIKLTKNMPYKLWYVICPSSMLRNPGWFCFTAFYRRWMMHVGEMSFDIDFRTRFMVLFIQTDVARLCASFQANTSLHFYTSSSLLHYRKTKFITICQQFTRKWYMMCSR